MKKFNSNSISRNNKYNGAGGAGGGGTASDIAYDNSLSGLVSENVQQAIDELHDEIELGTVYSTDEVHIGEWIDGKPIYGKVLDLGNNVGIFTDSDRVFTNQELFRALNCESFLKGFFIVNDSTYHGVYIPTELYINGNTYGYKAVDQWDANVNRNVKLYIEFTKTTD